MKRTVQAEMCATCPWREGSPYAYLVPMLSASAFREASRICHSTGTNAIMRTTKREQLCRGARNAQLNLFHKMGFLSAPTDAAWIAKCAELGIAPDTTRRKAGED